MTRLSALIISITQRCRYYTTGRSGISKMAESASCHVGRKELEDKLKEWNIDYDTIEHPAVTFYLHFVSRSN